MVCWLNLPVDAASSFDIFVQATLHILQKFGNPCKRVWGGERRENKRRERESGEAATPLDKATSRRRVGAME